jgi:hypothetical protein
VERHDSTAKHLGWCGALLGAALTVAAPPVRVGTLAAGSAAGAGAAVGHFWHKLLKDTVRQMGDLLGAGHSEFVVLGIITTALTSKCCSRTHRRRS